MTGAGTPGKGTSFMRARAVIGIAAFAAAAIAAPLAMADRAERNSSPVAATAPSGASATRTYPAPMDALLAADLDYLVRDARRQYASGQREGAEAMLVYFDEMAAGDWAGARAALEATSGGMDGGQAGLFAPFLFAAEGNVAGALERARGSLDELPSPLPELMGALVLESAGRFEDAATAYAAIERDLDTRPLPSGEPQSLEDIGRMLTANRTTNALYRAALVNHYLSRRAEADRLYALVDTLAPNSSDVAFNRARLARGEQPVEPRLDARRALGRWLIFLADHLQQTEGLAALASSDEPASGLTSPSSAMFLQFGIMFDPAADDWRIHAASQLLGVEAYDGAERLLAPIDRNSPYAAEADLTRASILLGRERDDQAVAAAGRALAAAPDRWAVVAGAGDVYRIAGRARQAREAFDRALTLTQSQKDRADVLRYRAYAHRFAGDMAPAVADARAALALDQSDDTRMLYVSILMDDRDAWQDGVTVARTMFAERPDSVSRLNTLGYALIQRPEGLEEGYRLLWRGFVLGERDYAVIDSLGWAYYLHGAFEQARVLIERANELTGTDENAEILDHLGDVYWRLDRRDDARTAWNKALAARPDALRRTALQRKLDSGLTSPAPQYRALPQVELPSGQRDNT